jgi:hypothetical protein
MEPVTLRFVADCLNRVPVVYIQYRKEFTIIRLHFAPSVQYLELEGVLLNEQLIS